MMHSEKFCTNLDSLDKVKAIRAVQEAYLQLSAMGNYAEVDGVMYDNTPALGALLDVLKDAGHIGFDEE